MCYRRPPGYWESRLSDSHADMMPPDLRPAAEPGCPARHCSVTTLRRYIRDGELFTVNASGRGGL